MRFLLLAFLVSCSTATSYRPYGETLPPSKGPVKVISMGEQTPGSCKAIGEIHIYDPGMADNCGYDQVLSEAKREAALKGGNTFKVTRVSPPDFWLSWNCYRIRGEVLNCREEEEE
jgi:hypothetical protein